MPGLKNQEWWIKEFFYLVAPKKWKCDMMGFLANTFRYVRLLDIK